MYLFQFLQALDSSIIAKECKIHLACWNGIENPLDVYFAGLFADWQAVQNNRNFKRKMVVSLIALSESNRWLFVGVYDVHDSRPFGNSNQIWYDTSLKKITEDLCGRIVVEFKRSGRQSYLNAENWTESLLLAELRAKRLQVVDFPGYMKTMISMPQLKIIVEQQNPSWKSALSSVNGVYVISDKATGKLYVGSATGEGGIWGRWCAYAQTGHGGNKELRRLLREQGHDHSANFQFGVLETADSRATEKEFLGRESHWKELLLTRTPHGYNA